LICFWCDVFLVFFSGDGRRIPSKNVAEAATDAAAGGADVILASAHRFVVFDGADCIVLSFDSSQEYSFARITEGIFDEGGRVELARHKKDGRMLCLRINMILFSFQGHLIARKMLSGEVRDVAM